MVPPLEPQYHRPAPRRGLDKGTLALLVDERLALRARIRTRLERARAAVARALLESKAHEEAGYSNLRDYAREELGISLRALQESAQLDRVLSAFPRFEEAVSAGNLAGSRALEVAPVLSAETEQAWLKLARTHTVLQLRRLVHAVREQMPLRGRRPAAEPPTPRSSSARRFAPGCFGRPMSRKAPARPVGRPHRARRSRSSWPSSGSSFPFDRRSRRTRRERRCR